MKKTILSVCAALLLSGAVAAVDIPMRDGSVIAAESYRLTGSYIMIELPNGAQVAYDAADVDLPALRAAEAAAAETAGPSAEEQSAPEAGGDNISGGRSLKNAADVGGELSGSRTITDRDVRHVRRGVEGDEEGDGGQGEAGGAPGGSQQGGGVVLNNLQVTAMGEGSWNVEGEVVNGLSEPVLNVKVKLQASTSGEPWTGEVPVASMLQPNEAGVFSHSFSAEIPANRTQPDVRASVMWMQQQSRREPDYTKAGGVPHPSNLPLEHGGVSGADVVPQPTPVQ